MNFAHSGHQHVEQVYGLNSNPLNDILTNSVPFLLLLLIMLFFKFGLKTKPSVNINITMIYLLIIGLTSYQIAPIASIVSLISGFGLGLVIMLARLKN